MKTNNLKQIVFPLMGLLLSSCAIHGTKSDDTLAFTIINSSIPVDPPISLPETSSSERAVNYTLVSETREGLEETYASFFKVTFECNLLSVNIRYGDGFLYDKADEVIVGSSSHYEYWKSKSAGYCDTYYHDLDFERWAFVDEEGNKVVAYGDKYYYVGEEAYQNTYKYYKNEIDLPGYLEEIMTSQDPIIEDNIESRYDAVYKTYLSETDDGYSDMLITVNVKDTEGKDLELARLEASSKDGLVYGAAYSFMNVGRYYYQGILIEEYFEKSSKYFRFSSYEGLETNIPDISDWEDATGMMDNN